LLGKIFFENHINNESFSITTLINQDVDESIYLCRIRGGDQRGYLHAVRQDQLQQVLISYRDSLKILGRQRLELTVLSTR
jgi:hypothetical protein